MDFVVVVVGLQSGSELPIITGGEFTVVEVGVRIVLIVIVAGFYVGVDDVVVVRGRLTVR